SLWSSLGSSGSSVSSLGSSGSSGSSFGSSGSSGSSFGSSGSSGSSFGSSGSSGSSFGSSFTSIPTFGGSTGLNQRSPPVAICSVCPKEFQATVPTFVSSGALIDQTISIDSPGFIIKSSAVTNLRAVTVVKSVGGSVSQLFSGFSVPSSSIDTLSLVL